MAQTRDFTVDAFRAHLLTLKAPETARNYCLAARKFVEYVRSQRIIVQKAPWALQGYANWMLSHGLKPASVASLVPGARSYLEWRRFQGDLLPVFSSVQLPRYHRAPPYALRDRALEMFEHITNQEEEPYRTALLLMPLCGLRAGEMAYLRLAQIKRDVRDPSRFAFADVRGKSADVRTVPILAPGTAILREYLKGWRNEALLSTWLFPSGRHRGKPVQPRTLRVHMKEIRDRFDKRLHLHTLRVTWSTALLEQGVPIDQVADMAGHRSIQTTFRHYRASAAPGLLSRSTQKVRVYK